MTAEELAALAAAVLSLFFSYIPGLSDWYGKLGSEVKRLIMAGLLIVVAAAVFGLACAGWFGPTGITCDQPGLIGLIKVLIAAIVANQGVYRLSYKSRSRKQA